MSTPQQEVKEPLASSSSADTSSSDSNQQQQQLSAPYHVLLESCSEKERPIDDRLKNDYLSRRYRATQKIRRLNANANTNNETSPRTPFWSGARSNEVRLVSCCDSVARDGVLDANKGIEFAGICACSCTDLVSRSLALAILERTIQRWEQDQESAEEEVNAKKKKRPKTDCDGDSDEKQQEVSTEQELKYFSEFYSAGGLRILATWFVEATTPEPVPAPSTAKLSSTTKSKRSDTSNLPQRPSPTSPLLLVLISVLTRLPLDRSLITESKLNKVIRKFNKQVPEEETRKRKTVHPVLGKHSSLKVREALKELMTVWQEKSTAVSYKPAPDPFAAVKKELARKKEEYDASQKNNGDGNNTPTWIANLQAKAAEEAAGMKKRSRPNPKSSAATAMAKLDKKKDQELLRVAKDLEHAAAERRETLRRIQEMRKRRSVQEDHYGGARRRRVQWKDGEGPTSQSKKADLLEEVFIFIKEEKQPRRPTKIHEGLALDGDIAVPGENISGKMKDEEDDSVL